MEEMAQYETAMLYWLSEIKLLTDPTLSLREGIMAGSSFKAFWRTLVYNYEPRFNYDSLNQWPEDCLGNSFGYWYLFKKSHMAKRWQHNLINWAFNCKILETLAAPFEDAERRVRHAWKFFVSQKGRIGWVPFSHTGWGPSLRLLWDEDSRDPEITGRAMGVHRSLLSSWVNGWRGL
jgi:hypothetical protein